MLLAFLPRGGCVVLPCGSSQMLLQFVPGFVNIQGERFCVVVIILQHECSEVIALSIRRINR